VLHISSGAAHRAVEYGGLYCISKAALLMTYRAWNADFPGGEILVGSARPGVVDGPMQEAARSGDYPGVQMYRDFQAKGYLLPPARVADFLSWLLLETEDPEFVGQEWNIYDEVHHPRWLKGPLGAQLPPRS
jgi:NAD(P)-dependent dehydrogenase (short-subunit alcohol dehydrogenase family)